MVDWPSFLSDLSPPVVYAVLFAVLLVEGTDLPVPYEPVFIVVGQLITDNRLQLTQTVLIGTAGNLIGNLVARYGRWLHVGPAELAAAERWFVRHGLWAAFATRFFGVFRTPAIIGAGLARMNPWRFTIASSFGALLWTVVWIYGAVALDHFLPPAWRQAVAWLSVAAALSILLVPFLMRCLLCKPN